MPELKRARKLDPTHKRNVIPRGIGDAALVVVVCLLTYTIAAVVWGWTVPTLAIEVMPDLSAESVPGTEDAKFAAFGRAILTTSCIAFVASIWAFVTRVRSLSMMLWLGLVTGFGSLWFVVLGNTVARATHPAPASHPEPGQTIEALSPISLSPALLLAPTLALMFYWVASSFVDSRKF